MDLTEEQIDAIAQRAAEKYLLMLPKVIGNVILELTYQHSVVKKTYEENKSWQGHKEVVGKVLYEVEKENPGRTLDEYVELAKSRINRAVEIASGLSLEPRR